MGWAEISNPLAQESVADRRLRRLLALFPDRATYEHWLDGRQVPDEHRAHMERFLPDHLKPQGTV